MADNEDQGGVVAAPTYMADIRFLFRPVDVEHMGRYGIVLSTYEGVKEHALQVYVATNAATTKPGERMPPEGFGPSWSAEQSQTFKNWILNGYKLGTATARPTGELEAQAPPARVRKNVDSLSPDEIQTLKSAFAGLMARDPKSAGDPVDPNSYFALAGLHGLPGIWCLHHTFPFNPWHRVYVKQFEDQLRSIPGCEEVTLPYWDFRSSPLPALLQEAPFASYSLPQAVKNIDFPFTTARYSSDEITANMQQYGVFTDVDLSLKQSLWGDYNTNGYQDFSIQAHDGGHNSIGTTMGDQDVASYDPVFWFFHANIDRLWLTWQQLVGATTLTGFETTISPGDIDWLRPGLNALPPFATESNETIAFGIGYDQLAVSSEDAALENKAGSVDAAHSFSIKRSDPVSVRVKDINRLNIPGSFVVHLLADGKPIASRAFFQPKSPRDCQNCRQLELINIDFRIEAEKLLERELSVEIEVPRLKDSGARFPLAQAGNPTINARLLLDEG